MQTKIFLDEGEMPKRWYNIQADLPTPLDPPLNPATGKPATPDDLRHIFPMELIRQEMSTKALHRYPCRSPGYPHPLETKPPLPGKKA